MKKTWIGLGIALALSAALINGWCKIPTTFEFHALNVGQGDALLLRTPSGENILIDGGPGETVLEELGEVLSPLDRKLDLVILTHPHEDHVAGLVAVLSRFEVEHVVLSAPVYNNRAYDALVKLIQVQSIPYAFADDDNDYVFSELTLDFVFPFAPFTGDSLDNVNNASPVIVATWRNVSILLTGDAEQEVEEALLNAGVSLDADILKAGHHGSRSSSTLAFLEAVSPALMVISCGEGNSYGHPHEETLQKAEDIGAAVLRTDLDGRISIGFEDQSFWRSIFAPKLRNFSSIF